MGTSNLGGGQLGDINLGNVGEDFYEIFVYEEVALTELYNTAASLVVEVSDSVAVAETFVASGIRLVSVVDAVTVVENTVSDILAIRETADHIEIVNTQIAAVRETADHIDVVTTSTPGPARVTQSYIEVVEKVLEARMSLEWELDVNSDLLLHTSHLYIGFGLQVVRTAKLPTARMSMVVSLEAIPMAPFVGEKCLTDESGNGQGGYSSYVF
jgi:hypothetical protein